MSLDDLGPFLSTIVVPVCVVLSSFVFPILLKFREHALRDAFINLFRSSACPSFELASILLLIFDLITLTSCFL